MEIPPYGKASQVKMNEYLKGSVLLFSPLCDSPAFTVVSVTQGALLWQGE